MASGISLGTVGRNSQLPARITGPGQWLCVLPVTHDASLPPDQGGSGQGQELLPLGEPCNLPLLLPGKRSWYSNALDSEQTLLSSARCVLTQFKIPRNDSPVACVDFVGGLNELRLIIYKSKITPKVNLGILKCEF